MTPFTIETEFQIGNDYYDMGEVNVKSQERMFGVAFNWYLVGNAAAINKFLWFSWIGYGAGRSLITGRNFKNSYQFQVKRIPSWRVGLKYRFRAGDEGDNLMSYGLGLNLMMSFESVHLLANETLYDNIDGERHFSDKRLSMGISFYF
jgi:hypothetical protein